MTFESIIDNVTENAAPTSTEQPAPIINEQPAIIKEQPVVVQQVVKISFGEDVRRATVTGVSFGALRDLAVTLFALDQRAVVLKYQDDDGDKITMSTDSELQEALKFAKDKNLLRLFVEAKAVPPQDFQPVAHNYGPFTHHHLQGQHGHQHGPRHGPSSSFPHPAFRAINNFVNSFTPAVQAFAPAAHTFTPAAQPTGPTASFYVPTVFAHGTFYPVDTVPDATVFNAHSAKNERKHDVKELKQAVKEQKQAMRDRVKIMKANASTPEDFRAIKELKDKMRAEFKAKWQSLNKDRKNARFVAKHVADLTIADNTELPMNTPVTKTWRLKNAGEVAWPADSHLIFLSSRGDNLNGPERVFVGAVEAQQEVDVSVAFITPSRAGRFTGYYRMASADGAKFGQRVWVSFIIPNHGESESAPVVSAPLLPTPVDDAAVASVPLVDASFVVIPRSQVADDSVASAPVATDDITVD